MILTSYWSLFVVNKKSKDLDNSFNKTISTLSIILFPISIGLYYLAEPIVLVIYQRGSFDINTAIITAKVFALFSIQIIPLYYNNVLSRILHVNKSLNYLFIFSMVAFILNTLLMYFLSIYTGLGILGIPIGLIIGRFSTTAVNFLYINHKYVNIQFKDLGIKNFKSMLATTVMIASLIIFNKLIELYMNYIVQVIILIINILLGAFVYFAILKLLNHPEFETIIMMLRKKLGKLK
jgi:putative peptidoglycan lipid II flippase